MDLKKIFGARIKELRLARQLTQDGLAERSGLAVDSIRRIERGAFSPSLDTLSKVARGLEISLRTLFDGLGRKQSTQLAEICDFLSHLNPTELRRVSRVVRAISDR